MVSYYDKLLVAIPALLGAGLLVSVHPAVAIYQGLAVGSILSTVVLFEAIFRNPPVEPTPASAVASVVVVVGWGVAVFASPL